MTLLCDVVFVTDLPVCGVVVFVTDLALCAHCDMVVFVSDLDVLGVAVFVADLVRGVVVSLTLVW